jgi:hypothetical protein
VVATLVADYGGGLGVRTMEEDQGGGGPTTGSGGRRQCWVEQRQIWAVAVWALCTCGRRERCEWVGRGAEARSAQ